MGPGTPTTSVDDMSRKKEDLPIASMNHQLPRGCHGDNLERPWEVSTSRYRQVFTFISHPQPRLYKCEAPVPITPCPPGGTQKPLNWTKLKNAWVLGAEAWGACHLSHRRLNQKLILSKVLTLQASQPISFLIRVLSGHLSCYPALRPFAAPSCAIPSVGPLYSSDLPVERCMC